MKLNLEAKLLRGIIENITPNSSTRPNGYLAWILDNVQKRMWNFNNCDVSWQSHLEDSEATHGCWEILKRLYGAVHQGRINFLARLLWTYKKQKDESIDQVATATRNIQISIRVVKPA